MEMTRDVETYLLEGCGRCSLGGTPECKVHTWNPALRELRRIALNSGLEETSKWGVPCYMLNGKNVFLISAFKDYCSVSFFKGVLINDEYQLLEKQGQNAHEDRILKFTDVKEVLEKEEIILSYMNQAALVEESGIPIPSRTNNHPDLPEELLIMFEKDPGYKSAFEALTPGRQRSYLYHFNGAKQSQTRVNRIEKCKEKVFSGKGFNEY